ncbi:MAG: 3-keto-5-aminohexanoate cleavage protein [Alphaproteobacteria bacterium]
MHSKVYITCAVTGASPVSKNAPQGFPKSNQQVAQSALEAAEAGAAICHIHVRKPDGRPSTDLADYKEVVETIRKKNTDVILNLTTGPGCGWAQSDDDPRMPAPGVNTMTAERRVEHVLALGQELATLDVCTIQARGGGIAINTDKMMTRMCNMFRDVKVKPEIECFSTGDIHFAHDLIDRGTIDTPSMWSFVLGSNFYGLEATPEAMMYCRSLMRPGAQWVGFGVSRHSFPMAALSVVLGGHVRVGYEDTIYLGKGKLAPTNASMVLQARQLIEGCGAEVATPGETRKILGLKEH